MKIRLLALGLVAAGLAWRALLPRVSAGDRAPGFQLTALDGSRFNLADYSGQVVVLNFFAPW